MNECCYPVCGLRATATRALVSMCRGHQEAIRTEFIRYYLTRGAYRRATYERIRHLTPLASREPEGGIEQ